MIPAAKILSIILGTVLCTRYDAQAEVSDLRLLVGAIASTCAALAR
jgi:hypothetical protein